MNAPVLCRHCGEKVPKGTELTARIEGCEQPVCCRGCKAAAQWIAEAGLSDYYRLRSREAERPEAVPGDHEAWKQADLRRHVVRELGEDRHEAALLVDGVRCAGCVWLIERALLQVAGVRQVSVNPVSRRARVVFDPQRVELSQLLDVLVHAGYRPMPLDAAALDDVRRSESRDALKRLLVAGFGMMQAMMFGMALWLGAFEDMGTATRDLFRWFGFIVATPVVLYSARPFFVGAKRALAARQLGMDVPVALAVALIYLASVVEMLIGGTEVYFESVSMFVFFLLIGRNLEMRARHRAVDSTDALARLTPAFADRRAADGSLQRVATIELRPDDCVLVAEGAHVPVDGVLISAKALLDEALVSGESSAQLKQRGDALIGGSVVVSGPLDFRVTQVGADTFLSQMAALALRAQTTRPRLARAGERATTLFVARVLTLTLITALAWWWFDPSRILSASLAVLVVSCPCAFALAVPSAITRALGVLARHGVLVIRPDALETLASVDVAMFDKTGTLTQATAATGMHAAEGVDAEDARNWATALARHSRHPVAQAIAQAEGESAMQVEQVTSIPGLGLEGVVDGRRLRLGRADFALGHDATESDEATVLAMDGKPLARFTFEEVLREGAQASLQALTDDGVQCVVLSGDAPARVARVAKHLGISECHARQLPKDKLARIRQWQSAGRCVLAVGDGSNDVPVLAGADVSVALSTGTELAQANADVVLCSGNLQALPQARAIARQSARILRQNQRWALVYNLTTIP
ncbi:MAG: heavy metal translocating P-type ATPase, partial [Xanthomonadales bacterium]|nr:heavy metal translocating P-type ATPase [Xanthomonadales bacterium]